MDDTGPVLKSIIVSFVHFYFSVFRLVPVSAFPIFFRPQLKLFPERESINFFATPIIDKSSEKIFFFYLKITFTVFKRFGVRETEGSVRNWRECVGSFPRFFRT